MILKIITFLLVAIPFGVIMFLVWRWDVRFERKEQARREHRRYMYQKIMSLVPWRK